MRLFVFISLLFVSCIAVPCVDQTIVEPLRETHTFTERGLALVQEMFADVVFDIAGVVQDSTNVLEIGCGQGHAILDAQFLAPGAHCTCVNKATYNFIQSNERRHFLSTAARFGVRLQCDEAGEVILPSLVLIESIVRAPSLVSQLGARRYDLIYSIHALNNKFLANETHIYYPDVVRLLTAHRRSMAALHVGELPVVIHSPTVGRTTCLKRFLVADMQIALCAYAHTNTSIGQRLIATIADENCPHIRKMDLVSADVLAELERAVFGTSSARFQHIVGPGTQFQQRSWTNMNIGLEAWQRFSLETRGNPMALWNMILEQPLEIKKMQQ
jgi:hypothetical protein